ncbi:MAG: hypothetical protein CL752_01900 [Chloroflexi bacterium]|nr:hypothetical protein [Chloroflexota bacterium]
MEKLQMKILIKFLILILFLTGFINVVYADNTFLSSETETYSHSFDRQALATDLDGNFLDNSIILPRTIDWFSDCDDGDYNSSCGGLPARWFPENSLIEVCTRQFNRPVTLSEESFNNSVIRAISMWNSTNAAVGLKYIGNCSLGVTAFFGNNINEIAFDDYRNVVRGSQAAITRGKWKNVTNNETGEKDKQFLETDVIIDENIDYPLVCFDSLVAHELGHVIGFGHSSIRNDLMYPTFNTADVSTCKTEASEFERKQLPELYGINRAPTISSVDVPNAYIDSTIILKAFAVDPDDDPLDFSWEQSQGSKLSFVNNNSQISFKIPKNAEGTFELIVTVKDKFGKSDSEIVSFDVEEELFLPTTIPSFIAFDAKKIIDKYESTFTWSNVEHAIEYKFCDYDFITKVYTNCFESDVPEITVHWKKKVLSPGREKELKQFYGNTRQIGMSGCNSAGCSDAGLGPHIGGIQWEHWDINFDFLAMAYDVPAANLKFSIGGVVNLEDEPRSFQIWSGTLSEPLKKKILSCGILYPGDSCIGLVMPDQVGHYSHISIISKSSRSPTTQNQILIR